MNIEHLKRVRAVVGNELLIILDCFMSLSVPYAIDLVQRISKEVPGGVMCLEEIMMPQAYDEMAEVKAKVGHLVQFSTGEHEYGLRAFKSILEKKCADMIQPNITVCGGLTEARRICSLARAFDIPVIFHGSSSFSYHIQFALKSCPYGELLLVCPEASTISPLFGNLFLDEPLPVNGYIRLPNKPGFGLTLNKENIFVRPCERTREWVEKTLRLPLLSLRSLDSSALAQCAHKKIQPHPFTALRQRRVGALSHRVSG